MDTWTPDEPNVSAMPHGLYGHKRRFIGWQRQRDFEKD
jgi:hypothetical protein